MIVCPNCNHQNPEGAVQCEACYTPLPAMTSCPNCGAKVQADASFCGQCGFNLHAAGSSANDVPLAVTPTLAPDFEIPDVPFPEPLVPPDPLISGVPPLPPPEAEPLPSLPIAPFPVPAPPPEGGGQSVENIPPPLSPTPPTPPPPPKPQPLNPAATQLQSQSARLIHVQTDTVIQLPQNIAVLHLGKPNDRIPPDIDVSGFPSSEIVSRIHADIRVEGDAYYIEDIGSSNGTYVNNMPLSLGTRHRLRPGDRIALGKGDRVTFLFQLSS